MCRNVALLLFLLVLLSACSGGRAGNVPTISVPIIATGTDALHLGFLEGLPPRTVYEGQPFTVSVEMHNAGAHDIEDGTYLIGYEPSVIDFEGDSTSPFILPGKSLGEPQGTKDYTQAQVYARKLPPETETYTTTLSVTACYDYSTEADLSICIDPDPVADPRGKVCQMKPEVYAAGQGGPLAITKVEPRLLKSEDGLARLEFMINFRNSGKGIPVLREDLGLACDPRGAGGSVNKIRFSASLGASQLRCGVDKELEKVITLDKDEGQVRCSLDTQLSSNTAYTAPLKIYIEYGYSHTVTTQVQILDESR